MFRKHRDKLSRHLSTENESKQSDDEQGDGVFLNPWPAEAQKKRASEPVISHTSELNPGSSYSNSQIARKVSSAGSDLILDPQDGRITGSSILSTTDPLGLTLVYAFPDPTLDIIFLHGLGGTSIGTWSWERDPLNFWPPWLADDLELSRARIFTFGYNAAFTGQYTSLSILDFAKDLLFRMKTYSGDHQQDSALVGEFPIIFVTHSMGGLVVKKAYIIGKADQQYANIIARVSAMVFLATPHKGSAFAQTLNSILKTSPSGSAKAYVAELEKQSSSLQDINEQFRNVCGDLELVSFYETLKTSLGAGIKKMLVDKDSALLEYPGETSSSLIADHHGMAKFKSPQDANYTSIKNVLRWLKRKTASRETTKQVFTFESHRAVENTSKLVITPSTELPVEKRLMSILGIAENVEDDLDFLTDRTMQGSCHWLLQRRAFQDWVAENPNTSRLLWLTGNPGSGKVHIGKLRRHFAQEKTKRTLSYLLRSVALQAALSHEAFCSRLIELHDNTEIVFSQQKATIIWEKIFEGILFRQPSKDPFYWIFDGLDEAESPTELIRFLSKIKSATRINVLLVSRATKNLSADIKVYLPTTVHEGISADDIVDDIRDYMRSSIQRILPGDHAQDDVVQDILSKASGSFLWVRLALDRIRDNWYTKDDIKAALTEIPRGMEPLYERMIEIIASQPPKPHEMATRILTWVACSFRPLELAELEVALIPEFRDLVNLKLTIEEVCGNFIVINKSKITLIHETAAQFLLRKTSGLRTKIVETEGHKHIAMVCIRLLSDTAKWRRVFSMIQMRQQSKSMVDSTVFDDYPFLSYSLTFWAYHVSLASVDSNELLEAILTFLEDCCLLWINGVALTQNLRILTQAAQHLKTFVKRRAYWIAKRSPTSLKLARDGELRQWANDLIRVVGRFGKNVTECPSSIHKYVIPFCPKDSIISRSFGHIGWSAFSVLGVSSKSWDDCLARVTMGEDQTASKVFCKDTFFVTLVGVDGTLIIWHSETCEEIRRFTHGEYVTHMASSKTSNLVATAGFKTTRIWDVTTGEELYRLPKERHHHSRALAFGPDDDEILVAYDDCSVQCFDLATSQENWHFLAKEPGSQDHNCARYMAFSPDLTQIAIVFRGRPVVVWNMQHSSSAYILPKRCVLAEDNMRSAIEGDAWNAPEVALWHPENDHLLIMYEDTKIVDWNVRDDEQIQYDHMDARGMVLSPDGNLLLTSDVNGTLSIWTIPEYRLTYQLKYDELVMDMAFSPDGTRFYDIRGTFCNVWEPDALIRSLDLDQDNLSSNYETITSEPVMSNDDNSRVPITALVCDSSDKFYCCGKEDGTVVMHSSPEGKKLRKVISHSSSASIIKLVWSVSEKYLASGDDSGRIIAKRLEPPSSGKDKWAVFPLFDRRIDEAVEQLLFSARDNFLLIGGRTTTYVMNLKSKTELCCTRHPDQMKGVWTNHPTAPTVLIRIDAGQARQYLWKTLTPKDGSISPSLQAEDPIESPYIIQRTIHVRGHWLVLESLATGRNYTGSQSRHIEALDVHKLNESMPIETSKRQKIDGLAKHVRRLIGCFQDHVVFLDHQFWLCTWAIEPVYSKHKRHFFLPKDWLSPTALRLLVLNRQGTLMCPRNGEVAIVRSGLKG